MAGHCIAPQAGAFQPGAIYFVKRFSSGVTTVLITPPAIQNGHPGNGALTVLFVQTVLKRSTIPLHLFTAHAHHTIQSDTSLHTIWN